jgi:hypothetical protein
MGVLIIFSRTLDLEHQKQTEALQRRCAVASDSAARHGIHSDRIIRRHDGNHAGIRADNTSERRAVVATNGTYLAAAGAWSKPRGNVPSRAIAIFAAGFDRYRAG